MYQLMTRWINRWRYWYMNRRIRYRFQSRYINCWWQRWQRIKSMRWGRRLMATPKAPQKIPTSIMPSSSSRSCWTVIGWIRRNWPRRLKKEKRRWQDWPGAIKRLAWRWVRRSRRRWMWSSCRWSNRSRSRSDINFRTKTMVKQKQQEWSSGQ